MKSCLIKLETSERFLYNKITVKLNSLLNQYNKKAVKMGEMNYDRQNV